MQSEEPVSNRLEWSNFYFLLSSFELPSFPISSFCFLVSSLYLPPPLPCGKTPFRLAASEP